MKNSKTQLFVSLIEDVVARAIEQVIDEGAKVENVPFGRSIDGVNLQYPSTTDCDATIVLFLWSDKIRAVMRGSDEELRQKRATLQDEIDRIDEQLKERTKQ